MASFQELRTMALKARKENSSERQEKYFRARDDAFSVITTDVMTKIHTAAKDGRFKFPVYTWTNTQRSSNTVTESVYVPVENPQLYFGNDENGKNGLHIMALMQPTGVKYEDTLISKLREFFNNQSVEEDEKSNKLRVFLQRRPTNPLQCAIFVSWELKSTVDGETKVRKVFEKRSNQTTRTVRVVKPSNSSNGEDATPVTTGEEFEIVRSRFDKKTRGLGGGGVSSRGGRK